MDFLANADEVRRGSHGEEYLRESRSQRDKRHTSKPTVPARGTHPRNVRVIPKSRDFH